MVSGAYFANGVGLFQQPVGRPEIVCLPAEFSIHWGIGHGEAEADGNRTHQAFVANASPILKTGAVTRPANASGPGQAARTGLPVRCVVGLDNEYGDHQRIFLPSEIQPVGPFALTRKR